MTEAEPVVGEIYATRTFGVTREGRLTGLHHQDFVWADGENTAVCHASGLVRKKGGSHRAPVLNCRCGFYGYTRTSQFAPKNQVMGVIACSGKTVAGELGLRAEKAQIVALYFGDDVPWKAKREVEKNYPSAEIFEDRDQLLAAYGLAGEPIPNAGTFQGFKNPKRTVIGRKLTQSQRGQGKQVAPGSAPDMGMIARLCKLLAVIGISAGLVLGSPAILIWFGSWVDPGLLDDYRHAAQIISPGLWICGINSSGTVIAPLLAALYLAGMSSIKRRAMTGYVWSTSILGFNLSSGLVLFGYLQNENGAGAVLTVFSIGWLISVAVVVVMLLRISFGPSEIRARSGGKSYFSLWLRQLLQGFGGFAYAPSSGVLEARRDPE